MPHTAVDVMTPYHGFAGKLIQTAIDPASPVSPFSPDGRHSLPVHDTSPDQAKTRLLIDRATPLVGRLVELTRMRLLRSVTHELLDLVRRR